MIFFFNGVLLFHAADCLAKLVAEAEKDADEEEVMTATFIGPPDVRSHAVLNNDGKYNTKRPRIDGIAASCSFLSELRGFYFLSICWRVLSDLRPCWLSLRRGWRQ
jgi:hypothetical protein